MENVTKYIYQIYNLPNQRSLFEELKISFFNIDFRLINNYSQPEAYFKINIKGIQ